MSKRSIRATLITATDRLDINGDDVDPQLEIDLAVNMSVTPTANMATMRVMNLSRSSRQALAGRIKRTLDISAAIVASPVPVPAGTDPIVQQTVTRRGDAYVEIDAGYGKELTRIFEGSTQFIHHVKQGATWVTEMQIGDGLSTMITGVAARSFPPGTLTRDVVRHVAKVMGIDDSVLRTPEAFAAAVGDGAITFPYGFTAFEDAKWLMTAILEPLGAEWFVDRGQFFLVKKGVALPEPPIVIDFESGLRSTPDLIENDDIRLRCMFRPDLRIGRLALIRNVDYDGEYRIESVMHRINNRRGEAVTEAFLSPKTL